MNKIKRRLRRKRGIRKKIFGTDLKPRITVFKSNRHLYVQAIDDYSGNTLSASSDIQTGVKRNREGAQQIGEDLAKKLSEKKVKEGIFDRNGYVYHGLISAIAEGVRKGGVKV